MTNPSRDLVRCALLLGLLISIAAATPNARAQTGTHVDAASQPQPTAAQPADRLPSAARTVSNLFSKQEAGEPAAKDARSANRRDRWTSGPLTYQEPQAPDPADLGGIAARLVLGTVVVLGACVVSLWLARRWLPGGAAPTKGQGRMKVIDTLSLAHRCCLQLVEIEGRQVLIGYDAGGIRTVTPLAPSFADEEEQAELAAASSDINTGTPWLRRSDIK
jgi:flagellar biogenesis protein FliO